MYVQFVDMYVHYVSDHMTSFIVFLPLSAQSFIKISESNFPALNINMDHTCSKALRSTCLLSIRWCCSGCPMLQNGPSASVLGQPTNGGLASQISSSQYLYTWWWYYSLLLLLQTHLLLLFLIFSITWTIFAVLGYYKQALQSQKKVAYFTDVGL